MSNFLGIGANIVGAAVIGGDTVIFVGSYPDLEAQSSTTVSLSTQTQTAAIVVAANGTQTVGPPTLSATSTVVVATASSLTIAVPSQSFTGTSAYYVSSSLTISVPSQSFAAEMPLNGESSLTAAGTPRYGQPVVGAFAVGGEAGDTVAVSKMAFVTQTTTVINYAQLAANQTISPPTLDANLRPIVSASSIVAIGLSGSSGTGDVDVGAVEGSTVAVPTQTATGTGPTDASVPPTGDQPPSAAQSAAQKQLSEATVLSAVRAGLIAARGILGEVVAVRRVRAAAAAAADLRELAGPAAATEPGLAEVGEDAGRLPQLPQERRQA